MSRRHNRIWRLTMPAEMPTTRIHMRIMVCPGSRQRHSLMRPFKEALSLLDQLVRRHARTEVLTTTAIRTSQAFQQWLGWERLARSPEDWPALAQLRRTFATWLLIVRGTIHLVLASIP